MTCWFSKRGLSRRREELDEGGASVGEELKHRSGGQAVYVSVYTRQTRERDRLKYEALRNEARRHRHLSA